MFCTTFPCQRRLKAGHVDSPIHSVLNCIELQLLGISSVKYFFLYLYCEWPLHTVQRTCSRSGFQSRLITLRGRLKKKKTSRLSAQKKCVLSAVASAKSTHNSNWCRQGAGQRSSRDNGETSCWCFQQSNSSSPGLQASRHLVSEAVSSQTWPCLYRGSLEIMMHSIFHQIPDATTKASNPSCTSVMCWRILHHPLWIHLPFFTTT